LNISAGFRDRRLGAEIFIAHPAAKQAFDLLQVHREAIEKDFGAPLDWQRMDDRKGCRIAVVRTDLDPTIESERPRQYAWLLDQMERFSRAFRDRIRGLPLDTTAPSDLPPASTAAADN
jgi:Domain of unknown function (DUF4268)